MYKMDLTIAIITRNRPDMFAKCLKSIINQSINGYTVLVIDNDKNNTARSVVNKYLLNSTIKFKYVNETNIGYANARNCAIKNCSTRYLGFVDDDCILDKNWVKTGMGSIVKNGVAWVVGESIDQCMSNSFGVLENYLRNYWRNQCYVNRYLEDPLPFHLDTKNVILDAQFLKSSNIYFDTKFNIYGGEDADLGFQIKHNNQKGIFNNNMVVNHFHPYNKAGFIRKAFAYGYNCFNLFDKWNGKNECYGWDNWKDYKFINSFKNIKLAFFSINHVTIFRRLQLYYLLKVFNLNYLKGFSYCQKIKYS